jgi:hypothetical protein
MGGGSDSRLERMKRESERLGGMGGRGTLGDERCFNNIAYSMADFKQRSCQLECRSSRWLLIHGWIAWQGKNAATNPRQDKTRRQRSLECSPICLAGKDTSYTISDSAARVGKGMKTSQDDDDEEQDKYNEQQG